MTQLIKEVISWQKVKGGINNLLDAFSWNPTQNCRTFFSFHHELAQ
jgi:hypothetical protein